MTAVKPLGFAILGTGMVADYHRQAIEANRAAGATLVAVGHYNPERFEAAAQAFGVPCLSQGDLLAHPGVDAVCICTPSGRHAAEAIAAAKAGKHVLVEKPLALSLKDADAMIAAAKAAGVTLGVVLQRRAEPLFRAVHDAIAAGDLGDLTLGAVTIAYHRPQNYFDQAGWRGTWALDGGGVLMNQGIHLVDLLVWYMGDPVEVKAFAGTLQHDIEVEDTLAATLRFANGALATVTATTTAAPGFAHRVEIYGAAGGIQIEGEGVSAWRLVLDASRIQPPGATKNGDAGSGGDPRGIKPAGHISVMRDFIESVRQGRPPRIDGAEGRRSLAAVLAVYRAAGLRPEGEQ